MIRTLIVDDEPLGQRRVAQLLETEPDIEIVGLCANGLEAVTTIKQERPDLLFLDIQMPVMNGFDVLRAVQGGPMPIVIFVTAYDQYALQAFEVHAFDYLLKPFDRERFYVTLARARTHLQRESLEHLHQRLHAFLETHERSATPTYEKRLSVKAGGQVHFIPVDSIDWIEAAGNYITLHVGAKNHLLRSTMQEIIGRLDPQQFLRIHRSLIVQTDRIRSIRPTQTGEYILTLDSGERLQSGRTYKAHIQALLDGV